MKTLERSFIFKGEMVEYIADYYSNIGEALTDAEYNELKNIYGPRPAENEWEKNIADFKDFTIWRKHNGDWVISRNA